MLCFFFSFDKNVCFVNSQTQEVRTMRNDSFHLPSYNNSLISTNINIISFYNSCIVALVPYVTQHILPLQFLYYVSRTNKNNTNVFINT